MSPRTPRTTSRYVAAPLTLAAYFAVATAATYLLTREGFVALNLVYVGAMTALGMLFYAAFPARRRRVGRLFSLVAVGGALFFGAGVFGRIDFQLEGFFFYAFAGVLTGTVVHYVVGKLIGPLVVGRTWCGWGCWTAAVLDFLPYKRSPGRIAGRWGWFRYGHFVLSAALVAALFFGLEYHIARRPYDPAAFYWFAGGNLLYYGAAVGLALALKDNRAFCKYLCPIVAFLKPAALPSLLKVGADAEKCDFCGACDKVCPMDVKVAAYAEAGRRVVASECIQCLTCVSACGKGALRATVALDAGGPSLLRYREPR